MLNTLSLGYSHGSSGMYCSTCQISSETGSEQSEVHLGHS